MDDKTQLERDQQEYAEWTARGCICGQGATCPEHPLVEQDSPDPPTDMPIST